MSIQNPSFNIVDAVLFQCRLQPAAAAICAPGARIGLISYRRLEQFIHNVCGRLTRFGFSTGSAVAVNVQEPVLHVAIVLALMRLGVASVSAQGSVPGDLAVDAMISDRPIAGSGDRQAIPADLSWTEGDGTPIGNRYAHAGKAQDTCRIILTSGTTGAPKAVAISHQLMFGRVGRHLTAFGNRLPACSRIYCDLTLRTSLGFQFLIYTLMRGGTFFFPGDNFENTLQALEEHKVQCAIGSPAGLETLLRFYDRYAVYQSKLEVAITAGDLLSDALSERVRSRLSSHLISVYGSTEASMTATAPAHAIARTPGAVGYVCAGVSIEAVDESGRILPPLSEGIIRVRSAFAVDRYLGSQPEAETPFREGWFYPGDIGAVSAEGVLVLAGRQKTVLNIGGEKISPEAIEAAIAAYDGIDECAAFSVPNKLGNEKVWAALVVNSRFNEDRLNEHCRAALPLHFLPSAFVLVDKLARNAMGKIERDLLKDLAAGQPAGLGA